MEQLYILQTPTWLILIPNIFQVMWHWTVMTRKVWLDWPSNDKSTKKPCRIDFKKWTYEGFLSWHLGICRNNVKFWRFYLFGIPKWLSGVIRGCYLTFPKDIQTHSEDRCERTPKHHLKLGFFLGVPFTPGLTWYDWRMATGCLRCYINSSCSFASMNLRSHRIKNKPRWWHLKYFLFSPLPGEDEPILTSFFHMGWNHQLETAIGFLP